MSIVLTVIVTFGFSHTVPADLAAPIFPIVFKIHAAIYIAWVLLFVAQPALVVRGSLALHRKLGWLGLALAGAMLVLGMWVILFALWNDTVPPFYPHPLFLVRGFITLIVFGGLVGAGIAFRKRAEWHRRLMLCASIVVIGPGLERALPIPLIGPAWPFVTDALLLALAMIGPIVDVFVRRRIHPAYVRGVGAILVGQLCVDILAPSSIATAWLRLLGAS